MRTETISHQVNTLDEFSLRSYYPKEETLLSRLTAIMSKQIEPLLAMLSSPIEMGGFDPLAPHTLCPQVVFGDIHGEIRGFIENLQHAGLIDAQGNWSNKNFTLVQLGDVIDRGIFSEECWDYLSELQEQAEAGNGRVVRLLGNHELMLLEGLDHLAKWVIRDLKSFTAKLKKDVLEGRVQLAYTDGKRLFIHAGIRTEIRNVLIRELMEIQSKGAKDIFIEDLVDHMNQILVKAVEEDDFSHSIFNVGVSRGGNQMIGGVLWEDIREIANSKGALDIPQVIGHNPPQGPHMPPIRITESQKLVEVDAGLNPIYGGRRAYVIFDESNIHILVKEQSKWIENIAHDHLVKSQTREA